MIQYSSPLILEPARFPDLGVTFAQIWNIISCGIMKLSSDDHLESPTGRHKISNDLYYYKKQL
jgi:hypothetical protein